jgi:hypothetical protein
MEQDESMFRSQIILAFPALFFFWSPASSRDLVKTIKDPPAMVWETTDHPDLKFCVITSIAARTGQASTVVEKGNDTVIIVHNWSSPVPGDDVLAVITIKQNRNVEFRGQKLELQPEIEPCMTL